MIATLKNEKIVVLNWWRGVRIFLHCIQFILARFVIRFSLFKYRVCVNRSYEKFYNRTLGMAYWVCKIWTPFGLAIMSSFIKRYKGPHFESFLFNFYFFTMSCAVLYPMENNVYVIHFRKFWAKNLKTYKQNAREHSFQTGRLRVWLYKVLKTDLRHGF